MQNPIRTDEIPNIHNIEIYVSDDGEIFVTNQGLNNRRLLCIAILIIGIAVVNLVGPLFAYQLLPGATSTASFTFVVGYFLLYAMLVWLLFRILRK